MSFRFNGHLVGDMGEYIPKEEYAAALAADPYPRYRKWLSDNGIASAAELDAIDGDAKKAVEEAMQFAFSSPLTDVAEIGRDIYATQVA